MHKVLIGFRSGWLGNREGILPMSRNVRRFFAAEDGASLVEYSLAVVLIGLAAVVVTSFVGQSTSDAFDEIGNAFPAESVVAAPLGDDITTDAFDALVDIVKGIDSPGNSFFSKVDGARLRYEAGDVDGALSQLDALSNQVDAQEGKSITPAEAAAIRDAAEDLVEAIDSG
jgi:Flp pilus assembly pilin Flp